MVAKVCITICDTIIILFLLVYDIAAKGRGGYGDDYYRGRGYGSGDSNYEGTGGGRSFFEAFGKTGGIVVIVLIIIFAMCVMCCMCGSDCRDDENSKGREDDEINDAQAVDDGIHENEACEVYFEPQTRSSKWIMEDGIWKKVDTEECNDTMMKDVVMKAMKEKLDEAVKEAKEKNIDCDRIEIECSREQYQEILQNVKNSRVSNIDTTDRTELRRKFFES